MKEKGQRIIELRKKGKTYGEIAEILNLPKSTVAWWLRDVKISKSLQKQILEKSRKKWRKNITVYNQTYAKIRSEEARLKREKNKEAGFKEISKKIKALSKKDLQLIGCMLYWAEGNTKNRHNIRFSNSNPLMIKAMMRFLREVCQISNQKITARPHLYPGINQQKAINYWMKVTDLPKANFRKPQIQISRTSKGKRARNTLPYGTLHLTAGNTEITSKVKGWIRGISEKF